MLSTMRMEKEIISKGLCVNCGACQGMCPYWQSSEGRTYTVFECDREDGRCVRFCPRMKTDRQELFSRFFPGQQVTDIGPYRKHLLARAANPGSGCQHGGVMTALVELAMEEGFIDAAVLTRSNGGLEPEGVLATTTGQVRACAGSSFQIPPTLAVLNKALTEGAYKSIGVVGTPCKTLAVYKMKAEPFSENSNCAESIGMVFGLFCGWGLDWKGMGELVSLHADANTVKHIDIPPSKYHCISIDEKDIPLEEVYPIVRESCRYCADMTAEFSDISVGGGRSSDGWETDKNWNQIIIRSEKGEKLIAIARERGILEFKDVPEGGMDKLMKAAKGKRDKAKEL